ncbi:Polycomb protein Su(z)12 [Eumeta japonica]|uniref:Polycomb protein Su(Z)12 n=1 Tax=Eumeta variegata TaxID=151549 RepID=A0A4C1WSP2_EUMVA|nr:Polycomb protein Su(z)12 [Eumeta japonica]
MPPKKRDKDNETSKNSKIDHLQADHELFLQAFERFYDKSLENPLDYQVKVETLLLKICHKKRKESSSAIIEMSVGSCSVPLNPSTSKPPAMASAVSISSDTFSPSQGPNVKSYMLMLRVTVTSVTAANSGTSNTSEITNGEPDEPVTKRLKPSPEQQMNSPHNSDKFSKLYGSELIVYDKHNRCLLTNGEYDLVLHDVAPGGRNASITKSPHKALMAQWETIPNENDIQSDTNPFDVFKVRPLLKLKLSWSQEPTNGLVNRPKLYQQSNDANGLKKDNILNKDTKPMSGGARIDVSINELYDGSYTGSPHDLIAAQGRSTAPGPRAGPTRRTSLTHVLVWWRPRGRRRAHRHSLDEFLELDDNELIDAQRPYLTGHNRLYHHTITCLPVYPNELDIDSEGETDPLWLQQKTMMMIDDFTDVNEGEKELMKMWNLHVMKYNYVGDCQIPLACQMFLQMRGKELLEKNLYRNFVLHMCSLHDFGLLSPVAMYQIMQMLNQMLADNSEAKEKMRESLKAQREHWNAVGKYQQPVVIEQKPQNNTAKLNTVEASPSVRRKTSNLQNANRMGTSNFNKATSPGPSNGEPKRKMSSGSIQSRKRSSISERKSSI